MVADGSPSGSISTSTTLRAVPPRVTVSVVGTGVVANVRCLIAGVEEMCPPEAQNPSNLGHDRTVFVGLFSQRYTSKE